MANNWKCERCDLIVHVDSDESQPRCPSCGLGMSKIKLRNYSMPADPGKFEGRSMYIFVRKCTLGLDILNRLMRLGNSLLGDSV